MARYSFRSGRSRRSRRRSRKLTKANIYGNRSARSQAGQIAALNRKINAVSKRTKPELHVLCSQNNAFTFTSNALSSVYNRFIMDLPTPNSPADNAFVGDMCHMLSLTLHAYAEYFNNSTTGYHDTESAGCVLRIIAVQYKDSQGIASPLANVNELLQSTGTTASGYTALAYAPFVTGISNRLRVLCDRKYILTTNRNQKLIKIRVPLGKYRDLRYDAATQYFSNVIQFWVIAGGLHYDSNYVETLQFTSMHKLVFRDN